MNNVYVYKFNTNCPGHEYEISSGVISIDWIYRLFADLNYHYQTH